jgi:uncharacterized protein (TIGR04141 family)
MSSVNKLSIYLIKDGITDPNQIISNYSDCKEIDGVGNFYYGRSIVNTPSWVDDFFLENLKGIKTLKSSSAKGVLLTSIIHNKKEIKFALSFGMGRNMINKDAVVERFGLITTLNTIATNCIRTIEKNNIAALSKLSKEQMSKDSEVSEFGIDIEQDLVRAVTGKPKIEGFGSIVSGSDSFCLSINKDISSISDFLCKCHQQYLKTDYKAEFGWIDQIEEIKKPKQIEELDLILLQRLNERKLENIWMAIPEILDWSDIKGFKYLYRQADCDDDISIEKFLENREKCIWADINQLKTKHVVAISASSDNEFMRWSIYKCIYGEIQTKGNQYVINNGKWYLINTDFVKKINDDYNMVPLSDITLPDYEHSNEGAYNKYVAETSNLYQCLDAKNIMYGGGQSKIEFCDLLSSEGKIVHIKKYAGSSVLSHLFYQGIVSGELFISDKEFRKDLNKKLRGQWKLKSSESKPNASDYEVIYGIISNIDEERPHIPFFSKVSFRNAKRRLESFGYTVKLKKISVVKN